MYDMCLKVVGIIGFCSCSRCIIKNIYDIINANKNKYI